ncbi:hypothetical protein BGW80DRAFT_1446662 [Lactifluus volemus]|nr:hypothetical protein BGW80DRAFT_1446662 [Lactifluus volemus]
MTSSPEYTLEIYVNFLKLAHTFAGLYLWEYLTTFDFEWGIYTGKRPWRWSFLAYIATRTLSLYNIINSLVGFNLSTEFNCEVWLRGCLLSGWFAGWFAAILLMLRGIAVWGRDRRIVAITSFLIVVDLFAACFAITRGHAQWSPLAQTCQVSNTNELKWPVMLSFLVDFLLLTIVLFGLLYKRLETHLWRMLFFQCLFWIVASLMTGVPDSILGIWFVPVALDALVYYLLKVFQYRCSYTLRWSSCTLIFTVFLEMSIHLHTGLLHLPEPIETSFDISLKPRNRQDVQIVVRKTAQVDVGVFELKALMTLCQHWWETKKPQFWGVLAVWEVLEADSAEDRSDRAQREQEPEDGACHGHKRPGPAVDNNRSPLGQSPTAVNYDTPSCLSSDPFFT